MLPALRGARVLDLVEGTDVAPEKIMEIEDNEGKNLRVEKTEYAAWYTRVLSW
jgi:hypothetical protein